MNSIDKIILEETSSSFRWIVSGRIYVDDDGNVGLAPPSPCHIGINFANPQHPIQIRLKDGTEFTNEHICKWAKGNPLGITIGSVLGIIERLSQIIVEKVLE